jgi:hypothetical protein
MGRRGSLKPRSMPARRKSRAATSRSPDALLVAARTREGYAMTLDDRIDFIGESLSL